MKRNLINVVALMVGFCLDAEPSDLMLLPTLDAPVISLQEALRLGFEKSSSVKKAREAVKIAEAETLASVSKILPKISLKSSLESVGKSRAIEDTVRAGLSLNLPLFDAKSLFDLKYRRELAVSLEAKYRDAENMLANDVATLYIEALIAQAAKENATLEYDLFKKQSEGFERQLKQLNVSNLAASRVTYLAHKALTDTFAKEQDFQRAMAELGKKIGRRELFKLEPFSIDSPHLAKDLDALVAMANEASDVKVIEQELLAAKVALLGEYVDLMPKLSLSADTGFSAPYANELFSRRDSLQARWMINLELPIFSGGSTVAAIKTKSAQKTIAEMNVKSKQTEKLLTINGLKKQIDDYEKMSISARSAFDAATKAQEAAYRLVEQGQIADYGRDLVDAITNYVAAKNQVVMMTLKRETAKIKLLYTIGAVREISSSK